MEQSIQPRHFNSVEEECYYYKELSKLYLQEKIDCQKEFENFTDESRQLENELEASIMQNERQIRDLNVQINSLRGDNENLRHKLMSHERDANLYEGKINQLASERDNLKVYIRELEQKNDDLERTNRVVSESVSGFEAMLNQAYEKNALLEMEMDEKEQLQINLQRLMDEARDLKQELRIRNISLPPKPTQEQKNDTTTATSTPTKDLNVNKSFAEGIMCNNKINSSSNNISNNHDMLDDSKNNNSLSMSSMDMPKPMSATFNQSSFNTSFSDTQNTSLGNNTTLRSLTDSPATTPNKSQNLLKYDCNLNNNPIAASTRVSALNIVADLLKKLDNLEAKLKAWKTQKPASQRLIESTLAANNDHSTCSVESLDKSNK